MATLITIPAGRSFRREAGSKFVDARPTRGVIEVSMGDDFLEFKWINKESGATDEELIIFPGEASFSKVSQDPSGRTHVLSFSSSDQKHFFWFQRVSNASDARDSVDLNEILQNPGYTLGSAPLPAATEPPVSAPTPGGASSSAPEASNASTSAAGGSQEAMARLIAEWARNGGLEHAPSPDDDVHLDDVLSPANIAALISSKPELIPTITSLLPPGVNLGSNPTPDEVIPILSAPQFKEAIESLDGALRRGGLPGSMMVELGLPESAGTSVNKFVEALIGLGEEKPSESGGASDAMETD